MGNYPNTKFGPAGVANAGGGGGSGFPSGSYTLTGSGSVLNALNKDVLNLSVPGGLDTDMQWAPAEVVKALPPTADFGAGPVALEAIWFGKAGTAPPPPDPSYVPIADLTQPSNTYTPNCPDAGSALPAEVIALYADGSTFVIGFVQVIITDNSNICGGP
jgi:hypothetical protein